MRKCSELRRLRNVDKSMRKRSELRRLRKGQTMLKQSQSCLTKPICRTHYQTIYWDSYVEDRHALNSFR